jgi:hypothetical protein
LGHGGAGNYQINDALCVGSVKFLSALDTVQRHVIRNIRDWPIFPHCYLQNILDR